MKRFLLSIVRPFCVSIPINCFCYGQCEMHRLKGLGIVFETHGVVEKVKQTPQEKKYEKLVRMLARKPYKATTVQLDDEQLMYDVKQLRALMRLD